MNINQLIDLDIEELRIQNERIMRILEDIYKKTTSNTQTEDALGQEYYTIEDCAKLKAGASISTYRNNRFWLPGCGNKEYEYHIAGRTCFHRSEVIIWLHTSDEIYKEYAYSRGITVIPQKYLKILEGGKK